jgi:hypothetical protein
MSKRKARSLKSVSTHRAGGFTSEGMVWVPWLILSLILAALLVVGWKASVDPGIAYLPSNGSTPWITYPSPGYTQPHPAVNLSALFRREFTLETLPRSAVLGVRAFRQFEVMVNGRAVSAEPAEASWKVERSDDIAGLLRVGKNSIEVRVSNDHGPPALWLRLDLLGRTLGSDSEWDVSWAGSAWRQAVLATEPMRGRRFDPALRIKGPVAALVARWTTILLFVIAAGIAMAACLWLVRRQKKDGTPANPSPWPLGIWILIAALLWTVLFMNNTHWLHPSTGFDAKAHLDYVRYLLEKRSLPLADQGWEMYQPPLYYVAAAAVLGGANLSVSDSGGALALRLLGLALGLINLALVGASLRLIFPVHSRRQVIGLVVAAFLPANLYLFQFPTNEALVITLSSAVLLIMLQNLRDEEPSFRRQGLLGVLFGLALLAKVSALFLAPIIFGVLALRVMCLPRDRRWRGLLGIGLVAAMALLVCGWHYGRVWVRFGSPLIGNWDVSAGFLWWQDPGYHTLADYLRFGRALTSPLFAGFNGVWDGFYSTLWGDGLISGRSVLTLAPPWSYELMSLGYLMALGLTIATAFGVLLIFITWIRRPNLIDTILLGQTSVVLVALVYVTLLIPSYAQTKAIYALPGGLLPLSAFIALGLDQAIGRRRWLAGILLTVLGTWAFTAYAAFWINGESARTRAALGIVSLVEGETDRGEALLRESLARDPGDWDARLALAQHMLNRRAPLAEVERVLDADRSQPDIAARHFTIGVMAARNREFDRALREATRAVTLDPDAPEGHALVANLLEYRGDLQDSVEAWRQVLRIDPYFRDAHQALAGLYARLGLADSASMHQMYATALGK